MAGEGMNGRSGKCWIKNLETQQRSEKWVFWGREDNFQGLILFVLFTNFKTWRNIKTGFKLKLNLAFFILMTILFKFYTILVSKVVIPLKIIEFYSKKYLKLLTKSLVFKNQKSDWKLCPLKLSSLQCFFFILLKHSLLNNLVSKTNWNFFLGVMSVNRRFFSCAFLFCVFFFFSWII